MVKYTNKHGISLPVAVWLLHDEYDYINDPRYISATTLLAPTRALILSKRVKPEDKEFDVSDFIASSFGSSVHDSMEKAWKKAGVEIMRKLGYPGHLCARIRINPTEDELKADPDILAVWIEERAFKEIDGWIIGGKKDLIIDKRLFDNKTTSVFTAIYGGRDEEYAKQGGIYRWLEPEKIEDDFIYIQYIFTDWKKSDARRNPNYPQLRTQEHPVRMLSIEDTETFIRSKLAEIVKYRDKPDSAIPECTDEELWKSDPKFKYYADPAKANEPGARSTKNFDTLAEANSFMASKAGKGIVKTIPGEVKRCPYCPAFDICEQRKRYEFPDE